ncbi:MAG: hypothetical protein NTV51_30230 [Verrucomicrobia bacterium]|nr:hypothetical protein [Verrucomicrobiota bacterium]
MSIILRVVAWIGLGLGLPALGLQAQPTYYFKFPALSETWRLQFPAPSADSVYRNSSAAIQILDVKGDGKTIRPEISGGGDHGIDDTAIPSKPGIVVYLMSRVRCESWQDPTAKSPNQRLRIFPLPDGVRLVEIRYRVSYPGGKISGPLTVVFSADDQPGYLLKLP